ncbi:uncharacterized protein LOC132747828 [Ruditapes philippinarum]|uniref:uncharacterized protein LOC132747828 n=1 Tax=Ruditapes philippinarum TaxID=129788 RepID=UPI00295B9B70|nr:uncharacterized protein LOC132747828 [Ruditapes philippinarum]
MAFAMLSVSLPEGSDEAQEMFCEHCNTHDKKHVPAEGFCEYCLVYLCGTCIKFHERYMLSHTIKDKDNMPQDFCFEKCSVHQDELIKFYCQVCEKIACIECKKEVHENCEAVKHLPSFVQGIENSKEVKVFSEDLEEFLKSMENTEVQVNTNLREINSLQSKALNTVMEKKEEILSTFKEYQKEVVDDFEKKMGETIRRLSEKRMILIELFGHKYKKLEETLEEEVTEIKEKIDTAKSGDQINIQNISKETSKIKEGVKMISSRMASYQNASQRCSLFVSLKKGQKSLKRLEANANNLCTTNKIHHYRVQRKANKQYLTVSNIEDAGQFFTFQEIQKSEVERIAHYNSDVEFSCDSFSSLCLFSEKTLLITRYHFTEMVIFKDLSVSASSYDRIDLPSRPCAVAKVDNCSVAITLPLLGIIRLITFSKSMIVTNTEDVKVGIKCRGVACKNDYLIVSYSTKPAMLKILDMSGKVLKIFCTDHGGNGLFDVPCFISLNTGKAIIYVSDYERNCVLGLNSNGEVKAIYKDDELEGPCQMTADRCGAMFVCGRMSNNIHQLSPDLTKVKILLDDDQGLDKPVGVAYCQNKNRLYVSQSEGFIKVYDLSLE